MFEQCSNSNKSIGCVGLISAFIVAMIIKSLLNGWVLSLLWQWFLVPIFGLPTLTILQAVGIFMTTNLVTSHLQNQPVEIKNATDFASEYFVVIVYPLLVAGMGWFVSGLI